MKSKLVRSVPFLTFLFVHAASADAAAQPIGECHDDQFHVGFFNGMWSPKNKAAWDRDMLALVDGYRHNGQKVEYELFYNRHTGGFQDLLEVCLQRLEELGTPLSQRPEVCWEALENVQDGIASKISAESSVAAVALSGLRAQLATRAVDKLRAFAQSLPTDLDYANHKAQLAKSIRKTVLVAHSQGNLFVNVAYSYASNLLGPSSVEVVHVAPASVHLNGAYTLADSDWVINVLLRSFGDLGSVPQPNVFKVPLLVDPTGHGLVDVYLNRSLETFSGQQGVRTHFLKALDSVVAPTCPTGETTCNIVDDNHDGQVDEGHAWSVTSWKPIFSVPQYPVYVRAVVLSNGYVAVVGGDSAGAGNDRGFVAVTDGAGQLVFEPAWTRIESPGIAISAVAEGPSGEIGALYSTTDYTTTCRNCPVVFSRVDGSNGKLRSSVALSLSFRPRDAQAMVWDGSQYVGLVRDADTSALRVVWLEPFSGTVTNSRLLPSDGVTSSSLAFGPEGLGWVRGFSTGRIDFGVTPSDGAIDVVLGPLSLVARDGVGVFGDGGGRGLVASGSDFIATFTATNSGLAQPQIARLSGSVIASGPVAAGPSGFGTKDVLMVGGNPVAVTISPTLPYEVRLRRLKGDLTPLVPSVPDTVIASDSGYVTAAGTPSGVLVFKGSFELGGSVDMARVGCQ